MKTNPVAVLSLFILVLAPVASGQQVASQGAGSHSQRSFVTDVNPVWPNVVCSIDRTNDVLYLFHPDGQLLATTPLPFDATGGLARDRFGRVLVAAGTEAFFVDLRSTPPSVRGALTSPGGFLGMPVVAPDDVIYILSPPLIHAYSRSGDFLESIAIGTSLPSTAGIAVAPNGGAPMGYYLWTVSYEESSATAELRRIDPAGVEPPIVIPYPGTRLRMVAVGADGDIWVPVEVGGSGSTDRLDRRSGAGAPISSSPTTGWTGTYMENIVVGPHRIFCIAADGHSASSINPSVLFEFDSSGTFLCGQDISCGSPQGTPRGLSVDGDGNAWASVTNANSLYRASGSCTVGTCIGAGGVFGRGDGTGFLLAYVQHPFEDFDLDGVPNRAELEAGTNPFE